MKKNRIITLLLPAYILVLSVFIVSAALISKSVTAMVENAPLDSRKCVVIDAGHGGVDGGATSCTGVLESQLNLEISLRVNDLLHLLGINTVMIRTDDISVYTEGESIAAKKISDLKERVRIVNTKENAVLLSIHMNHFTDSQYHGAQVFYAPTQGSQQFADTMQAALKNALDPENNRHIKKTKGVYLMEHINKTGILLECGFISNPAEEAKLTKADYQIKLSAVIATTTATYLANT